MGGGAKEKGVVCYHYWPYEYCCLNYRSSRTDRTLSGQAELKRGFSACRWNGLWPSPPPLFFFFLGTNVFPITRPCRAWQPGARGAGGDAMLAQLRGPSQKQAPRQSFTRPGSPRPPPAPAPPRVAARRTTPERNPARPAPRTFPGRGRNSAVRKWGAGAGGQGLCRRRRCCCCCQLRAPVPAAAGCYPSRLR